MLTGGWSLSLVKQLAADQIRLYRHHFTEMRPHFVHERSVARSYRGRQLLELLQNADDAGIGHPEPPRFLFRLNGDVLIAANSGAAFSAQGITSLVVSDRSPKPLERTRYIGNKGLGFRSLLSWSERPLVKSGAHVIAFSPEHAIQIAEEIANEVPELQEDMSKYAARSGTLPVPIMRFPYEPQTSDSRLALVDAIQKEGYETVIVLPIPAGERREAIIADIAHQAANVGAPTLLFSNHLAEVRVSIEGTSTTWSVDRQADAGKPTVTLQAGASFSTWTIHRRDVGVPGALLEEGAGPTSAGLAVAVPEEFGNGTDNTLCVFFPTSVALPICLVAHATLETDDSRKRLIQGSSTKFVLRELACFLAEVAEIETVASRDSWRGLKLLAGAERCDPELIHLGFADALQEEIRKRCLLPRIDGLVAPANQVWVPPAAVWRDVATGEWLGDLLAEAPSEDVESLLDYLKLRKMPPDEQAKRLERMIGAAATGEEILAAGTLIGRVLEMRALPKEPLAQVLIGDTGTPLGATDHVLFPPEGPAIHRPVWATDIRFLHPSFADGLRSSARMTTREVSRRFSELGYTVDEYQLDTVARRLLLSAERANADSPFEETERQLDVLQCVFDMARLQESTAPITVSLRVLTEGGRLRKATECYVGEAYSDGAFLKALYGPLGDDEFAAGPEQLHLAATAVEVEQFLVRLGVSKRVRRTVLDTSWAVRQAGLQGHVRETLARATYPRELADRVFDSAEAALAGLEIDYGTYKMLDRWSEVLLKGSPEAIVSFVATEGMHHLGVSSSNRIVPRARYGQQINPRYCQSLEVMDPALFLLRELPWVPADDGTRHPPRQIVLSKVARRVLGNAFRSHAIDPSSHFLTAVGGYAAVEMVLGATGAVHSLDALRGDDLYSLLLELPERDPDGAVAASVYRSLIEGGQLDTDSPKQDEFFRRGKMWGTRGLSSAYYPVTELRYAPRTGVPAPIRQHIPLVAIDPRRNASDVARIFGIAPLSSDEYEVVVENSETSCVPWSAVSAEHLRTAVPFLYALRLSQRADERGDEKRAFADLQLVVASQLVARVKLGQRMPESMHLNEDLKGFAAGRVVYIISALLNHSLDPVFWRAVADLVADVIGVPRASGDFGALLACSDDQQRTRLLDHMTGGSGATLLSQARDALEIGDSEEVLTRPVPPPVAASAPRTSSVEAEGPTGGRAIPPQPTDSPESLVPFAISPPQSHPRMTREMVVAGPSSGVSTRSEGSQLEDVTLGVAERFEQLASPPRFTLRVSHLRGSEAFGCDILSFATAQDRDRARDEQHVEPSHIVRYIEVKGRSSRTGPVELTDNERAAAAHLGSRYWVYRIFTDPARPSYHEVAVLPNPTNSPGQHYRTQWWYDFAAGSGADWYRMPTGDDIVVNETPAPDTEFGTG